MARAIVTYNASRLGYDVSIVRRAPEGSGRERETVLPDGSWEDAPEGNEIPIALRLTESEMAIAMYRMLVERDAGQASK